MPASAGYHRLKHDRNCSFKLTVLSCSRSCACVGRHAICCRFAKRLLNLVDRRLDEARGDRLAMTVAVRVVHDKARVVLELTDELLQFNQPSCRLLCPARRIYPPSNRCRCSSPADGELHHMMQLRDGARLGNQKSLPDRRADAAQPHSQLENGRYVGRLGVHRVL